MRSATTVAGFSVVVGGSRPPRLPAPPAHRRRRRAGPRPEGRPPAACGASFGALGRRHGCAAELGMRLHEVPHHGHQVEVERVGRLLVDHQRPMPLAVSMQASSSWRNPSSVMSVGRFMAPFVVGVREVREAVVPGARRRTRAPPRSAPRRTRVAAVAAHVRLRLLELGDLRLAGLPGVAHGRRLPGSLGVGGGEPRAVLVR